MVGGGREVGERVCVWVRDTMEWMRLGNYWEINQSDTPTLRLTGTKPTLFRCLLWIECSAAPISVGCPQSTKFRWELQTQLIPALIYLNLQKDSEGKWNVPSFCSRISLPSDNCNWAAFVSMLFAAEHTDIFYDVCQSNPLRNWQMRTICHTTGCDSEAKNPLRVRGAQKRLWCGWILLITWNICMDAFSTWSKFLWCFNHHGFWRPMWNELFG